MSISAGSRSGRRKRSPGERDMISRMRYLIPTIVLVLGLACSAPAQQPIAQSSDVAARVGDRTITVKEIDERWRQTSPTEQTAAVQRLYDGRKAALDAIVADLVIAQAASAKGSTPAEYTEAEIARRVMPVTDEE